MITFRKYFTEEVNPKFAQKLAELKELGFIIKEGEVGGDKAFLVFPAHLGVPWDKQNLIYRSSMWNENGEPISLSLKKFFNWTERSDLVPEPKDLTKTFARLKMDGSTLIVSKYKGELIHRTRGTFNAENLDTGGEIQDLIKRYPKAFDNELVNSEEYSVIYEWVSPNNKIVLDYGPEPDIYLIAVARHKDYRMMDQSALDRYAKAWGVKRPEDYKFKDIPTMIDTVKALKGKEGICLYYSQGQNIKKIKSIEYLTKHAFKSNVSVNSIIDMFWSFDKPTYEEFMSKLEETFDFECATMAQALVSRVIDADRELNKMIDHMRKFVDPLRTVPRRDAAEAIMGAYGKTNKTGLAFKILDNKPLDERAYKNILRQLMEK